MTALRSLDVIRAHAAEYRVRRQIERDAEAHRDAEIRQLWPLGWSLDRIGIRLGLSSYAVARRRKAMGLPNRPHGFRREHAGLSPEEMGLYRLMVGNKGWSAAEARAEVLRLRRGAA